MSIDTAIVNLDRKEFFRPLDMNLPSEIRSIENYPSLFHVAVVRILVEGHDWFGNRIALIHDAGGPIAAPYPSWDHVMSRFNGWKNITPDVIANLVLQRLPVIDEQYGATPRELMHSLKMYVRDLEMELKEAKQDVEEDPDTWEKHLPAALEIELAEAREIYAKLAKHLKHENR